MSNIRHVAIILPSLRGGGAEKVAVRLSNFFSSAGCIVDLVLVKKEGPLVGDIDPGVGVYDLDRKRTISALPSLVAYLKNRSPVVVLSLMGHTNVLATLAVLVSGFGGRLVLSVHGNLKAHRSRQSRLRGLGLNVLTKWLYPRADSIIGVSSGLVAAIRSAVKIDPGKVHLVHNPIPQREFVIQASEPHGHPWLPPKSARETPVVVAAGRLTEVKDFQVFIRAIAMVLEDRPIRALIFGTGPLEEELKNQVAALNIAGNVELEGFVDNLAPFLKEADLFVLSSKNEGFSNVILEALAVGCRVVSTDCDFGPREILKAGEFGKLVPVGDAAQMARAILSSLEEAPKPEALMSRALDFDIDVIGRAYERILFPDFKAT